MALQSSPSSSSLDRDKYDVFLSIRGFDTRYGFTGNLYKALIDRKIHTFIDNRELKGGEEITPTLLKAIEDSRIAIIVFSENYAQSSFCLDELVHIIECSKAKDRLVLPVFYGVEPTHLRHHTGGYGEALAKHEAKFQVNNMERLQKWKTALNQAANLSGHHFKFNREQYEYEFIGKIVDIVSKKINHTPLYIQDFRVGLEPRVLQVKLLLNVESDDGVCMVGIHGMGGIEKSTLAREIYNSIFNHFEASCFLDDVRQNSLQNPQETLLHRTTREKDIKLGSVNDGMSVIRQRLQTKKVLLILDNVDDLKQLAALVGRRDWFGPGSRIIITTRDLYLLKRHGIEKTYEVGELDMDEALELLSLKAFGNNRVDPSDKDILKRAFTCASGLPLALEVVGSNLFGKKIEELEPILARYKRNPSKDIQKTLSRKAKTAHATMSDAQGLHAEGINATATSQTSVTATAQGSNSQGINATAQGTVPPAAQGSNSQGINATAQPSVPLTSIAQTSVPAATQRRNAQASVPTYAAPTVASTRRATTLPRIDKLPISRKRSLSATVTNPSVPTGAAKRSISATNPTLQTGAAKRSNSATNLSVPTAATKRSLFGSATNLQNPPNPQTHPAVTTQKKSLGLKKTRFSTRTTKWTIPYTGPGSDPKKPLVLQDDEGSN